MKESEILFNLNIAKLAAERSKAIRLKVGCVVTDSNGNFVAYGYNGTVIGTDNNCERKVYARDELDFHTKDYPYFDTDTITGSLSYRLETLPDVIHAETNVIAHAARRGISINNGSMFITHSPCIHCTAMLIQSGIKNVYFINEFRDYQKVLDKYQRLITFKRVNE